MTENRVYLNSDNFKNSFNEDEVEKLVFRSTVKYEIKQLLNEQIKGKIQHSKLINDKKNHGLKYQKEYFKLTEKCLTYEESKIIWNDSLIKKNLHTEFSSLKENIESIHADLRLIKASIKYKNRLLNK